MSQKDKVVLATFGQLNRDDRYKILTKIIGQGSQIFVRKEAYTNLAVSHIYQLKQNHEQLSKSFSNLKDVRLVKIINSGKTYIDYEYIKGINAEYEAFKSVILGDYEKTIRIIDRVFNIIDSLSSPRAKNENEVVKKMNDAYQLPVSSTKYINPGIIDFNIDNFIISSNDELVAFDYEWVFSQPIPSDYVKSRIIHAFFAKRSEAFAFLASEDRVFVSIQESGNQTLIPEQIYKYYSKIFTKESMNYYWKAEDIFQSFVNKFRKDTANTSYKTFKTKRLTSPQPTYPDTQEAIRISHESLTAQYEQLIKSLEAMQSHTRNLEKELKLIKSSNTYKVAKKMASTKAKLMKK